MAYDDYFYGYGFKPYVSVAARRAQAERDLANLRKKGRKTSPVVIEGRKIARTFWGEAWCDNLERYSDYANRLPRGRAYARNGSVIDLQLEAGSVAAFVSGSMLYKVTVTVGAVSNASWRAICRDCAGAIDSLVELLQGRFSKAVMARLCQERTGLFPAPKDIRFTCSCPDWASMCKHVAAVLYGIGARLDHQPELLFTLRKVNQQDLLTRAGSDLSKPKGPIGAKVLASDDLSELFGIEMAPATTPVRGAEAAPKRSTIGKAVAWSELTKVSKPEKPRAPMSTRPHGRRYRMSAAKRRAVSERMKKYWAARRAMQRKRTRDESP